MDRPAGRRSRGGQQAEGTDHQGSNQMLREPTDAECEGEEHDGQGCEGTTPGRHSHESAAAAATRITLPETGRGGLRAASMTATATVTASAASRPARS